MPYFSIVDNIQFIPHTWIRFEKVKFKNETQFQTRITRIKRKFMEELNSLSFWDLQEVQHWTLEKHNCIDDHKKYKTASLSIWHLDYLHLYLTLLLTLVLYLILEIALALDSCTCTWLLYLNLTLVLALVLELDSWTWLFHLTKPRPKSLSETWDLPSYWWDYLALQTVD